MAELIPAAQYLRMSTEHQRYSLQNQDEAISRYAAQAGYRIVSTYADRGRSGLTLRERAGLKALLADCLKPDRAFGAILVLDVSRWGRFQDPDQSAHYEFVCREAGVPVVYCAEAFENDRSAASTILKSMKRWMAAEYSRELSEKTALAHRLQAGMGMHQGGRRPYGYVRVALSPGGRSVELPSGTRKGAQGDRVFLRQGPDEERQVIRRIFRDYVGRRRGITAIVRALNAEGVATNDGRPWTYYRVRRILRNELAIGRYVYNRTIVRLKAYPVKTPPESWTRATVDDPIVPERLFREAAALLAKGVRGQRNERVTLLRGLKRLWRERGRINAREIKLCPYLPSAEAVAWHFRTLGAAYRAVGFKKTSSPWQDGRGQPMTDDELLAKLRALHARLGYLSSKAVDRDLMTPSVSVYVLRFGSILAAYKAAGLPHDLGELKRASARRCAHKQTGRKPQPIPSDEALLAHLQTMFRRHGYVSALLLRREDGPTDSFYFKRFGSLREAYERAGLPHETSDLQRASWQRQQKVPHGGGPSAGRR